MALIKPPVLPPWAEAGDKIQPTNAELQAGWPLSNTPPSRQRMNWVKNYLMNGVRYLTRRGISDYDAAETYMIGDRTLAANGKTYRCKVDNTTNKEPSANAAEWEIWGFSKSDLSAAGLFITPAQFDSSTKAATTEFVQRALGNYAGYVNIAANNTPVNVSDAGKLHNISSAAVTTTLPALAGVPVGAAFSFKNTGGANNNVIYANGADVILTSNSSVSAVSLQNGLDLTVIKISAAAWMAFGSAVDKYLPHWSFGSAASGYQKFPSGLILQWGATGVKGGSTTSSIPLPIAFPNSNLAVFLTPTTAGSNGQQNSKVTSPSSTGFSYVNYSSTAEECFFLAIGY